MCLNNFYKLSVLSSEKLAIKKSNIKIHYDLDFEYQMFTLVSNNTYNDTSRY